MILWDAWCGWKIFPRVTCRRAMTQTLVDDLMPAAGYEPDVNWMTRVFPGARHSEADWAMRVHIPVEFMLS